MIIITGMHRSGTSLTSKISNHIGMDMGSSETFFPADHWNPRGYYEQMDILDVNKKILHGGFGKLSYFFLPSKKQVLARAVGQKTKIQSLAEKYSTAVIKDPRFAITLPAWKQYASNVVNKIVVCFRHPHQVAQSLKTRNHAPIQHGYYLWKTHYDRLWEELDNIPVWYVSYNELIRQDSSIELAGLLKFLESPLETSVDQIKQACISPNLNRHSNIDQRNEYPDQISKVLTKLQTLHEKQFNE